MSLEPNTDRINGHFLSNVLFKALPGGLTDFLVVSCPVYVLYGVQRKRDGCVDVLYGNSCDRRTDDPVQDCIADEHGFTGFSGSV